MHNDLVGSAGMSPTISVSFQPILPGEAPLLCAVRPDGTFNEDVPSLTGKWVKDADRDRERAQQYRRTASASGATTIFLGRPP